MHVQKLTVLRDFLNIHETVCFKEIVLICRNNVLGLVYKLISMKKVKIDLVELM